MQAIDVLESIVRRRRTTKAAAMNAQRIPDNQIRQLLELADWAPNHGKTEPWRFFVYTDQALHEFGEQHARMYWAHTPESKRTRAKYEKLQMSARQASHLVIAVMKRTKQARIPVLEETAAVAAAIENLLLGAAALELSAIWSTGGMAHHPAMKQALHLDESDVIMGLLYLGYSDLPVRKGKRQLPLSEKVQWMG